MFRARFPHRAEEKNAVRSEDSELSYDYSAR